MYGPLPSTPIELKNTLNDWWRWKISRYSPTAMTPISSAASPIRATRPRVLVPEKLKPRATTRKRIDRSTVTSLVTGMLNRLARKPLPNSATAVIVTIMAQM